jgi:ubiquinone/menaquinone biosynthesis C-methylase UbiE
MSKNFWNKVFKKKKWGEYPSEHLVRFVAKNYYQYKNKKKIKVLEIGCGTGANIKYLCEQGFDVYGLDYSNIAIMRAKKKLKKNKLSANLNCGNANNIKYPNNFFDLIIDIECLYYSSLKDKDMILQEIHRTLKSNKRALFFSQFFSAKTTSFIETAKNSIKFINSNEIKNFFCIFNKISYEIARRTLSNRKYIVEEFLIKCIK